MKNTAPIFPALKISSFFSFLFHLRKKTAYTPSYLCNHKKLSSMETNQNWNIIETDGDFHKIQDPETGLFGLLIGDKLRYAPEWFEVTRYPKYWYLRKNQESQCYFFATKKYSRTTGGPTNADKIQDDNSIISYDNKTGKFGFINYCGVRILNNDYDEIYKWDECDVVYTRKGRVVKYYDTSGNKILKHIRNIPNATDYDEPYYIGEPQTNIIQTMDMTANPVGDDFCTCYGIRTGLSRRTRPEHMAFLESIANERRISRRAKRVFKSKYTYIFSSFVVESTPGASRPIYDCLKQLWDREIFESSWGWIIVVVLPQKPTIEQKQETDWLIDCIMANGFSYAHRIAYGINPTLKEGAVIYATRVFKDAGPGFLNYLIPVTFDSFEEDTALVAARGFNQFDLNNALYDTVRYPDRWANNKKFADWLIEHGALFNKNILNEISLFDEGVNVVELIKWILKPQHACLNVDINSYSLGNTILDDVINWPQPDKSAQAILIDFLKANGAKTYMELRSEQAASFDYDAPVFLS